ncbi:MAG: SURF1 family protein [Rhizobiaceae bacterium]|nr:SURF1 family protein [Rhizobiaceae bacterium]
MNAATVPDRFPWAALLAGLVALAVLLALGTWQVRRLAWKEALVARIETRLASAPVSLAEAERMFALSGEVDYLPVRLAGRFDHAHEAHFLATWKGEAGFFVYTPLILDGRAVLVNRGFVPYARKDAASRPEGQVGGVVTVQGLARDPLPGKPSWVVPDNDPARNVFYWKDMQAMAAAAGYPDAAGRVPFFVDAGDAPNPGGLPVGGVTLVDLPNNHLQYAVTWFGLAAALVGVMGTWLWRRRTAA